MSRDFALALSFLLAVTVMTLPTGSAVYDHILLLPGLFWLGSHREEVVRAGRPLRLLLVVALLALAWPWIGACLVDVLVWIVPAWRGTAQLLVLPLRTAAPLSFALLAALTFFVLQRSANGDSELRQEVPALAG
jgi:hypothetical protein